MGNAPRNDDRHDPGTPPRVVVAIPPSDLLLEIAMNLLPLAEEGAITLVLSPESPETRDGDEGLVIRRAGGGDGRRTLLRVTGPSETGICDTICRTSFSWLGSPVQPRVERGQGLDGELVEDRVSVGNTPM